MEEEKQQSPPQADSVSSVDQDNNNNRGIDFRSALEILNDRHNNTAAHHQHTDGCHHEPAPDGSKEWGQRLDLLEQQQQKQQQTQEQLEAQLETLTCAQLWKVVLDAQAQRVETYKQYNRGLDDLIRTRALVRYPTLVSEATANFTVLSQTIGKAQNRLSNPHISQLQRLEQEKLQLTAAWHLETIRQAGSSDNDNDDLLQQDAQNLRHQIRTLVEQINEVVEEMRYASLEANDKEGGEEE